ncbi:MAG: hypothetical protein ACRDAW_01985 [Metamycoplasmataceae bacterium]
MNKKLLISLSSVSIAAVGLPILATISCSSEAPAIVNLTISAKANPQITNTDITALEVGNPSSKLTALQKLFEGKDLISANLKNFSISINKGRKIVTLTAKSGYTIDGKNTLASNVYTEEVTPPTDTDLKITAKPSPKLTIVQETQLETGNDTEKETVLGLLFDPITTENYKNFTFEVNKGTKIVTLTAKKGFVFGNSNTLNSNTYTIDTIAPKDLTITAKASPKLTGIQTIDLLKVDDAKQLIILKELFDGQDLTSTNQANFTVSIDNDKKIVTLTAATNFLIGGKTKLDSNLYTVEDSRVNISAKSPTAAIKLSQAEIDILKNTSSPNLAVQLPILQKLFDGVDNTTQAYFKVVVDETNKLVSITALPGIILVYSANGSGTFISVKYEIA